jgi:hypothetical protein
VYSHCIYCKSELGSNEAIEKFPIGRRLAFDAERGRLWVVCRSCGRWNLTPIEERWEAIEQCEQLYRDTRTRVATENVGLARLPDRTDLIRIGRPQLPEFAAWRYGERLVQRRRNYIIGATVAIGVTAVAAGAPLMAAGFSVPALWQVPGLVNRLRNSRTIARVKTAAGVEFKVSRGRALQAWLRPEHTHWLLALPLKGGGVISLEGESAMRAAAVLLPHINASGAKRDQVQGAVNQIQMYLTTDRLFQNTAQHLWNLRTGRDGAPLSKAPPEIRLALEMATHEAQERRALEGELAELETMWREAEEIASISDNLLLPSSVTDFFKRNK